MGNRTMQDYKELLEQKKAELKSDPDYARSRRKWQIVTAVILGIVGALCGLAGGAIGVPIGLLVGVGLGWLLGGWFKSLHTGSVAGDWAQQQYMSAWASERGLSYSQTCPVYNDVNMLRRGERWDASDEFTGPLYEGIDGSVYNFTYETRETRTVTDSDGNTRTEEYWEKHPQTVLRLELPLGLDFLSVQPRAAKLLKMFDGMESKLTSRRTVQLESIDFHDKFQLAVHDGDDDIQVRQLFDPTLIMHFVDAGKSIPELEANAHHLVMMRPGHFDCTDSDGLGEIEQLLDHMKTIVEKLAFNARQSKATAA